MIKISLLQMKIENFAFAKNRQNLRRLVEEACQNQPDIIVLPELWDSGFYPASPSSCTHESLISRELLAELAVTYRVNIVGGSIITERQGRIYNTCICFDREGQQAGTYDKMHLFSPAGEHKDFTHGEKVSVFNLDEFPCGAAICYDLRFPELMRQMAARGAKLIFLPAEWPKSRLAHWQILNKARAVENQIFLVAVNGIGQFVSGMPLAGHSMVIDPWGQVLAEADDTETIIDVTLDPAQIFRVRKAINVWQDLRFDVAIHS